MKLSNKKIKYIKRQALTQSPEDTAFELKIRVKDVNKVLSKIKSDKNNHPIYLINWLDKLLRYGLIILPFLAPFVFIKNMRDFANLPQTAFIQCGGAIIILIWLLQGSLKSELRIVRSSFYLPVILFILWSGISLTHAHNRYEGFQPWIHWAFCALIFLGTANILKKNKDIVFLLVGLTVAGTLTAITGIFQYLLECSWIPQALPPAATFANKNMASHFIVLTFPLSLGFLLASKRKAVIFSACLATALMIVFALYTQTRAGWISLAAEILVFGALLTREYSFQNKVFFWNKIKTLAVFTALLIIFIMVNIGPRGFKWEMGSVANRIATITDFRPEALVKSEEADTSITWRLDVWKNTVEMIKDHFWLGIGLGNHKLFYPLYHSRGKQKTPYLVHTQLANVHNDYLQVFSELGFFVIPIFIWTVIILLRTLRSLTLPSSHQINRFYIIGLASAIFGIMVNACFSFPLHRAIPPLVIMLYLGILASLFARKQDSVYLVRSVPVIILTILFTAIGTWLSYFYIREIQCDRSYMDTVKYDKTRQWHKVIESGTTAYRLNPNRAMVLSAVGRAYNELGKYKESLQVLKKVIDAYPNYINAWLNMGIAWHGLGDDAKALEALNKTLSIKPDYSKALYNMGIIYLAQKDWARAFEVYRKTALLEPNNSLTQYKLGTAAVNLKDYPAALKAFKKAIELTPAWAQAHEAVGVVYFQFLGDKNKGLFHLKKALDLDPQIENADQIWNLLEHQRLEETE